MVHTILTFVAKVEPSKRGDLEHLLDEIRHDLRRNPHLPFESLTRLHFASMFILDDDEFGPSLVFESNFDGSLNDYLDDLVKLSAPGLHRLLSCCLHYCGTGPDDSDAIVSYLRSHVVWPAASFVGTFGRTAECIRQEAALRNRIEAHLDELVSTAPCTADPLKLQQSIQDMVRHDPALSWVAHVAQSPGATSAPSLVVWGTIAGVVVLAIMLWPLPLVLVGVWIALLLWHEWRDRMSEQRVEPIHLQRLTQDEDHIVQNHLTTIIAVKPGLFRQITLRLVLLFVKISAQQARKGELAGISSIHFAHWSLLDNGRRLLFLSNYDGSWERYLDDFIDKASQGLTAIWSNTIGFPRTHGLFLFGGSRDGNRFKAHVRNNQVFTPVWYSAYPRLSVQNIDAGSSIRAGIFSEHDAPALQAWLRHF